jgi:YebC/PmpR family DNA-binding regulatory protein
MAGHSHAKNIKHKKDAADQKRGKLFSKISRLIIVAAKHGGGDPEANLKLRFAVDKARSVSMPVDTIDRAIKKGTGELEGGQLDEVLYEGYGPGGVAVLCEALTDNRNRTAGEVRKTFEVNGGKVGTAGCVGWMFKPMGVFVVEAKSVEEDRLLEVSLDAGAQDVKRVDDMFEVVCEGTQFAAVKKSLEEARIATTSGEISQVPNTYIDLDEETARKLLRLIEALDDMDDVQNVYSNSNIPEAVLAESGT